MKLYKNIPYGQSSAKIHVTHVIMSSVMSRHIHLSKKNNEEEEEEAEEREIYLHLFSLSALYYV